MPMPLPLPPTPTPMLISMAFLCRSNCVRPLREGETRRKMMQRTRSSVLIAMLKLLFLHLVPPPNLFVSMQCSVVIYVSILRLFGRERERQRVNGDGGRKATKRGREGPEGHEENRIMLCAKERDGLGTIIQWQRLAGAESSVGTDHGWPWEDWLLTSSGLDIADGVVRGAAAAVIFTAGCTFNRTASPGEAVAAILIDTTTSGA
ncbi:hypothetical protein C4D60_Mb04t05900 [Musa balbisiana]|uniref:Uncharacterized protein n=1 Tax=Musa balbisiana TaxID=52838 RepID=A0A4S8KA17_MUSBA|nr:hypothetical protein C4D60_Mb04t05900 [Musa balbisiana]